MFASSNRETEEPYVLEVNSNPALLVLKRLFPQQQKEYLTILKIVIIGLDF